MVPCFTDKIDYLGRVPLLRKLEIALQNTDAIKQLEKQQIVKTLRLFQEFCHVC